MAAMAEVSVGGEVFTDCRIHADSYKKELKMYCLDCVNGAFCSLCLPHHKDHNVIQIRKLSYKDVVRAKEIEKVIDISGVQTYVINSDKVDFLNRRPQQPRPGKGFSSTCQVCDRPLFYSFNFCCIACKAFGTSKDSEKKVMEMESEGLYNSTIKLQKKKVQSLSPSTQLPTVDMGSRTCKRRKGIPHKAPRTGPSVEHY